MLLLKSVLLNLLLKVLLVLKVKGLVMLLVMKNLDQRFLLVMKVFLLI